MTTKAPSRSGPLRTRLRTFASKEKAAQLMRFFKTGPGQYGEGDRFLGVMVPQTRRVAKEFRDLPLPEVGELLRSPWHEERLCALLLMVGRFERGDAVARKELFDLYLGSTATINSWDLVDVSAHRIVGAWLEDRSRAPPPGSFVRRRRRRRAGRRNPEVPGSRLDKRMWNSPYMSRTPCRRPASGRGSCHEPQAHIV
jgi:hypothetical protein